MGEVMPEHSVLWFDDVEATRSSLVGGKGANLARLTTAGFPVPAGFIVSTDAYAALLAEGTGDRIAAVARELTYDDPEALERGTATIRDLILNVALPDDLTAEVARAYGELGGDRLVAVRSSGTAEDLAEASFAGLHDTYLAIRGTDEVLDAVRRCWASMWSARAVHYRHDKGFDHDEVRIAVVVQEMVDSEVSGVMFTGNPLTAATDETVINASWGLGEAIVSGIVTPDEYLIGTGTLRTHREHIGSKSVQIVRDGDRGTITREVDRRDQERPALSGPEREELVRLGRRVTQYYGGLPQDIEWALIAGRFVLLQSRPITGVDFSWDSDVDAWQAEPDDPDTIWTRAMADEVWHGAVTPLMYSWRARLWQLAHVKYMGSDWELDEARRTRLFKFHRGEVYFNCRWQRIVAEKSCPPLFRPAMLDKIPPPWQPDVLAAPFDTRDYLRKYVKMQFGPPAGRFFRWIDMWAGWVTERYDEASGMSPEKLPTLSDRELTDYIDRMIAMEGSLYLPFWVPWWIYIRDLAVILGGMIEKWYDGDNPAVMIELMTGVPERTATQIENLDLWRLAQEIASVPALRALLENSSPEEFFAGLRGSDDGRAFLIRYEDFAQRNGHRGHAERDMYFPRRAEDNSCDYRALRALLDSEDPEIREHEVNERRRVIIEEVVVNMRAKPFGFAKAAAFRFVLNYLTKFFLLRDNERFLADRSTFTIKLGFLELNRRMRERAILAEERDFYFLTRDELFALLDGSGDDPALVEAKITARKRDFDSFNSKDRVPPFYLQYNREVEFDTEESPDTMRGVGTSRGKVTATARVVRGLEDIGRIQRGEILVCNSTDPGWTPIFLVVSGVVGETGGLMAHFSCLSREYGLPALQLSNATRLIPDGATITIDGDSGQVSIVEAAPEMVPA